MLALSAASARRAAAARAATRCLATPPPPPPPPQQQHWPVVIVGAGPTGATLASLLGAARVPTLLLDAAPTPFAHPAAHFINARSMETLRGVRAPDEGMEASVAAAVAAATPPADHWRRFIYCTAAAGPELASVDHFGGGAGASHRGDGAPGDPATPASVAHLSQHRLLPLLLAARARVAAWQVRAGCRPGEAWHGCRVESVQGGARGRPSAVAFTRGSGAPESVTADHVVAADGARSTLRTAAGVGMAGDGVLGHMLSIHFTSRAAGAALASSPRPAMLYFVFNGAMAGAIVAHDLRAGEFVAQVPAFPPLLGADAFTPARLEAMLRLSLGVPGADIELHAVRPWTMASRVATAWAAGGLLFAGDAAREVPPAGGLGLNTGLADAAALAWRLAAVVHGRAPRALLATYGAERGPVSAAVAALSTQNWRAALAVPRALGLDDRAAGAAASLGSALAGVLPAGVAAKGLDALMATARSAAATAGPPPLHAWRARRARAALDALGGGLRLLFPGYDLGTSVARLPGAALAADDPRAGARAPPWPPADPGARYVESTAPGCRLPHAWVEVVGEGGAAAGDHPPRVALSGRVSTVDLAPAAGGAALLITGAAGNAWRAAAASLSGALLASVVVADAGAPLDPDPATTLATDLDGTWPALSGIGPTGALLVRPDGVVGWRAVAAPPAGERAALASALAAVFGGDAARCV